jgi:hypothetical protein
MRHSGIETVCYNQKPSDEYQELTVNITVIEICKWSSNFLTLLILRYNLALDVDISIIRQPSDQYITQRSHRRQNATITYHAIWQLLEVKNNR